MKERVELETENERKQRERERDREDKGVRERGEREMGRAKVLMETG